MRKKRIFKKSLAINLIQYGCNLVDIEKHREHQHIDIYVFQNNFLLQEALAHFG